MPAADGFGAALGFLGGIGGALLARRDATRVRRRQRRAIAQADALAAQRVSEITGEGTLFGLAKNFLTDTFENAADSPLANDFAKRIRAQQAARGTFNAGNLAATQEAIATSSLAQNLRGSLLPQALQFSFAPEQFRQSIAAFETPRLIAAATGGQLAGVGPSNIVGLGDILNSGIQGAAGGFQIGSGFSQQQQQQSILQQLLQNQSNQQIGATGGFDPSQFFG